MYCLSTKDLIIYLPRRFLISIIRNKNDMIIFNEATIQLILTIGDVGIKDDKNIGRFPELNFQGTLEIQITLK